jgi:3-isopropylmalate/(R)-2-methylmalate dehydratase small subunit
MQPFTAHRGIAVPLTRRDIDTDQIIPKQFLKSIERAGFGRYLFHDWRVRADGSLDPAFVLNQPRYGAASILIAGANFGCGSSREHAAWALIDHGFRAIIASSFADIFRANAITNGLVPVTVDDATVATLAQRAASEDRYELEIDLAGQRVRDAHGVDVAFTISPAARQRLLHGLDDIDLILQHEAAIAAYESAIRPIRPRS